MNNGQRQMNGDTASVLIDRSNDRQPAEDRHPDLRPADISNEHQGEDHSPESAQERTNSEPTEKAKLNTGSKKTMPRQSQCDELRQTQAFQDDLFSIATLLDRECRAGLEVGEIANKWIGDHRYSRFLNADIFAREFQQLTGRRDLSGRKVRYYVSAYQERQFHETSGKRYPNLAVGHLAQIAACRCASDEERLELADRVDRKNATVKQVKTLAARLHGELTQARRTIDVEPLDFRVRVMEAHDLLLEQKDKSIECAILDWQWSDLEWGRNLDYPKVHTPADPAGHLCRCLEILKEKVAPVGSIFLYYTPVGFLDRRIAETCTRVGLQHAGKLIWQKTCGGFQDADTMLRIGHEEVHILCHSNTKPKAVNGGTNSVTPKWGAPTHATSGHQLDALHRHQKPVALMELLIAIATVDGLVCDPFAGSGSAGVAAVRRGCPYVGSELMPEIAQTANRRIALAKGDNDEVVEAINFMLEGASDQQYEVIASALKKSSLRCVRKSLREERP